MVDVILVILALAVVAALVALRRKPGGGAQPQARLPLPPGSGEPRQAGRLAAALAASSQGPNPVPPPPAPALAAAGYGALAAGGMPLGPAASVPVPGPAPRPFAPAPGANPTAVLGRPPQACLELLTGEEPGKRHPLLPGDNRVGRGQGNHLRLPDRTVSNQHAILRVAPGQVLLFDDSSTNGTFVNGQRVLQPRPLSHGDRIAVGQTVLVLHLETAADPGIPH